MRTPSRQAFYRVYHSARPAMMVYVTIHTACVLLHTCPQALHISHSSSESCAQSHALNVYSFSIHQSSPFRVIRLVTVTCRHKQVCKATSKGQEQEYGRACGHTGAGSCDQQRPTITLSTSHHLTSLHQQQVWPLYCRYLLLA